MKQQIQTLQRTLSSVFTQFLVGLENKKI